MYYKLLELEFKNFFRNPQFGTNLLLKILSFIGMLMMSSFFVIGAFALYFLPTEELNIDSLSFVTKYLLYYLAADLVIRFFFQKMPTQNIKPFLTIGISKKVLVNYTILKIFFNFFNWGNLLLLVPYTLLLLSDHNYSTVNIIAFSFGVYLLFYINNFINILMNGKDSFVLTFGAIIISLGLLNYFGLLELTHYSTEIFMSLYKMPYLVFLIVVALILFALAARKVIHSNFYLDKGLEVDQKVSSFKELKFLRKFGVTGTFLNNDLKLMTRSKAARSALFLSFFFLFYGFFIYTPTYESAYAQLFLGIFISGNFIMVFGQRMPSWESSYYPLLMTQNIPYLQYIKAKWTLMIISVVISTAISSLYIFLDKNLYLTILGAGFYNIGVNSYLVLLSGAFNKRPIDLNSASKSFGSNSNNLNKNMILLIIPQIVLPMIIFGIANYFFSIYIGVISLMVCGIIGLFLRNVIFNRIIKVYKLEKYKTLESYKKFN